MKSDHSTSVIQKGQKLVTYLFFLKHTLIYICLSWLFSVLFSDWSIWFFTNMTRRLQYPRWGKSWFILCHEIPARTVVYPSPRHSTRWDIWLWLPLFSTGDLSTLSAGVCYHRFLLLLSFQHFQPFAALMSPSASVNGERRTRMEKRNSCSIQTQLSHPYMVLGQPTHLTPGLFQKFLQQLSSSDGTKSKKTSWAGRGKKNHLALKQEAMKIIRWAQIGFCDGRLMSTWGKHTNFCSRTGCE